MKIAVVNLMVLTGASSLVYGAWSAWTPAGPLVLGVLLLCAAVKLGATKAK